MKQTITTPHRKVVAQLVGACYENDLPWGAMVAQAGFSEGTGTKDKQAPGGMTLDRLLRYMQVLGITELTIRR